MSTHFYKAALDEMRRAYMTHMSIWLSSDPNGLGGYALHVGEKPESGEWIEYRPAPEREEMRPFKKALLHTVNDGRNHLTISNYAPPSQRTDECNRLCRVIEYREIEAEKQEEKVAERKWWAWKEGGCLGGIDTDGRSTITAIYGHKPDPGRAKLDGDYVPVEVRELEEAEPEPARCVCGNSAGVAGGTGVRWNVYCHSANCWTGRSYPTRRAAVEAWNARMWT